MEVKFLLGFALNMLGSLLGGLAGSPEQASPSKVDVRPAVIEQRLEHRLEVPGFVIKVPTGHFAGVSAPCPSIAEARRSAVDDAIRQILSSVSIQYDHQYSDRVSGNVRNVNLNRMIDDRLSGAAHGVVLGVEQGIVKSSWSRDGSRRFVYFILVRYPERKIAEMRRLSNGAKVLASVVSDSGGDVRVRVSEVNGVGVVITSAGVVVRKRNRFAKAISYYVVHVPQGSEAKVSVPVNVKVCGNSRVVRLPLSGCGKRFSDYLLGAKVQKVAVLRGHDEIGRNVRVKVVF